MASPAQVANDMSIRARLWSGRDKNKESICRISAVVIRAYLQGYPPDGRTVRGCLDRLWSAEAWARGTPDLLSSLQRARETIMKLRAEAAQ